MELPTLRDWPAIKNGEMVLHNGEQILPCETAIEIVFTRLPPHFDYQIETLLRFETAGVFTLRDVVRIIYETYGTEYPDDHQLEGIEIETPSRVSFIMGS